MDNRQLIVFDMDGVLIDVSRSYRDTVAATARLFFRGARQWEVLPEPMFTPQDLAAVKQSGGLNNDWDLTAHVLKLLFSIIADQSKAAPPDRPLNPTDHQAMIKTYDLSGLAQYLRDTPSGLIRLHLDRKAPCRSSLIDRCYQGDVGSGNIVKQIFQEVYLGKTLYRKTYALTAAYYEGQGYMNRESALVSRPLLERLAQGRILAIATGRPGAEARYALEAFKLLPFFEHVYTLDHCLAEEERLRLQNDRSGSLSKPHPYMLDAIAAQADPDNTMAKYYVGDMPDDMIAARRSRYGFKGVGILLSAPDKAQLESDLKDAGAARLIQDFDALEAYLCQRPTV
jgi:HAD superfamily hydrolase (TIGR01548 family)